MVRGQLIRALCDNSSLYKQKLAKTKPLAGKVATVKKLEPKKKKAKLNFWLSVCAVFGPQNSMRT